MRSCLHLGHRFVCTERGERGKEQAGIGERRNEFNSVTTEGFISVDQAYKSFAD